MRPDRPIRKNALAKTARAHAPAALPPSAPSVMASRVAFVLYAIGMIGSLGTITALIERAAP